MDNIRSPFSPRKKLFLRHNISKTPASILKKRGLIDRHVKVTPRSKKQLQFSFVKSPGSSAGRSRPDEVLSPGVINDGDGYLQELMKFRSENEELCMSRDNRRVTQKEKRNVTSPFSNSTNLRRRISATLAPRNRTPGSPAPSISELAQHACIHNYRLNERLFAEPIIADEQGRSLCPICQHPEPSNPTERSPHFVRVSIPTGVIKSPIRVRPHRKKSFDPSDSFALAQHCLAGYMPPKSDIASTMKPGAANYDLISSAFAAKCHVTVTTRDLQKIALRDRQVAEHRAISLGKRAAFNQSLTAAKRLQSPRRTANTAPSPDCDVCKNEELRQNPRQMFLAQKRYLPFIPSSLIGKRAKRTKRHK